MQRISGLILVLALAATVALAVAFEGNRETPGTSDGTDGSVAIPSVDPRRTIVDAGGARVPIRQYQRILSASTPMDRVLLSLVARDRIAAMTAYTLERDPQREQLRGIPALKRLDDLEGVLSLRPDLILMNGYGDVGRIQRLRDQGLAVFDLGREQGFDALLADIEVLGRLIDLPGQAKRYAEQLQQQMEEAAPNLAEAEKKTAIYVSPAGDHIYGGSRGSHQHDILRFAGLVDVAAEAHSGFPDYRTEELLTYSPDVVVTKTGSTALLCARPGLSSWRPCQERERIVELDEALLDSGGPAMLDAVRQLRKRMDRNP